MTDTDIEYTTLRARNLSRELLLRGESPINPNDTGLIAAALASYGKALHAGRVEKDLDAMTRAIVADYTDELADAFKNGVSAVGPTDGELCSRALKFHAASLRTNHAEAA